MLLTVPTLLLALFCEVPGNLDYLSILPPLVVCNLFLSTEFLLEFYVVEDLTFVRSMGVALITEFYVIFEFE